MNEINKIYIATVVAGLASAASVVSTIYFLSNGLNQTQIGLLFSVLFITQASFEIPTGALADSFGHKFSVFIGLFIQSIGFLVLAIGNNFNAFLVSMFLNGLGLSLISGAYSALIYDILKKLGRSDEFAKVRGRSDSFLLIGLLLLSPLISVIYKSYPKLPYLLASALCLAAGILIYQIKWEFVKQKVSFKSYFEKAFTGIKETITSKKLLILVFLSIVLALSRSIYSQNINQPLQLSLGIDIALIGTVAAIIMGAESLISAFSYKLFKKIDVSFSLLLIVLVPAACSIILSRLSTDFGIIFILLFFVAHTYRDQIIASLVQEEISDSHRSTMGSAVSFLTYISVGLILPLGGYIIDIIGLKEALFLSGVLTLVFGLFGVLIFKFSGFKRA